MLRTASRTNLATRPLSECRRPLFQATLAVDKKVFRRMVLKLRNLILPALPPFEFNTDTLALVPRRNWCSRVFWCTRELLNVEQVTIRLQNGGCHAVLPSLSRHLLQRANSRCNHVPQRAAQENRTILIGVVFKNRHDVDKALERSEFKNRRNLCPLHCQRFVIALEVRRGIFLHWSRVDDSNSVLNDRPPGP